MSQYYFLQLGKRTESVKFFFSIKTLDNVLKISELKYHLLFESSILYQAFPLKTVSYQRRILKTLNSLFVT